jgi:integrase
VKLLMLTGCRLNEVIALRWTEVDEAAGCFRLAESKEGASTRPIGKSAFAVLAQLDRTAGSDWVLPGKRRDLPYGGIRRVWQDVRGRSSLAGITPHTLRHSFASMAGDLGYSESTIAAMLGHAAGSVTGRYTHHLDSVLIAAADRIAGEIMSLGHSCSSQAV